MSSTIPSHILSFVRRQRYFTPAQRRGLEQYWDQYGLVANQFPHLDEHLPSPSQIKLEIGFGNGEVLFGLAQKEPTVAYIGVDVYRPGVGQLLNKIGKHGVENIRLMCDDIVDCIQQQPTRALFDQVLILFPDPWQKKRHQKRRLITPAFCSQLAPWMKPNAHLHLATDWDDYAQQMLSVVEECPSLSRLKHTTSPEHRLYPQTAFERRGLRRDHLIHHIDCYKTAT
ncbi:MAG: tRNA (guanosine(46)-N7)-methyltransferase TrmB [Candidatus Oxydemutatoraceae bacterium WSBS_2016_MAG_OTU14]